MKRLVITLGLVLLLALAACNTPQPEVQEALPTDAAPAQPTGDLAPTEAAAEAPAEPAPGGDQVIPTLTGTVWEWVDLTTPVETISAVDPGRYTIEFMEDGTAAIKADCNRVTATYVADSAGAISIALGASTMAACPPDTQDQVFLGALATAASYFAFETDDSLFLSQFADAGTLRFRPAADSAATAGEGEAATSLTGVTWEWVSSIDPMGQTAANDPTRYTITFNADGTASIKADCNMVQATYITDASNLSIELGASTMAACPEDSQAQLFLAGLASAGMYTVEDGELFIELEAGAGTLLFRQAGSAAGEGESPAGAAEPTLTGVNWEWVSTTTPTETITAAEPSRYTVVFNDDGSVGIKADCNTALGTYTTGEGNTLTIALGPTTLVACPPDSQADVFLAGLAGAALYSFDGADLLIDQFADAGTLRFRAAAGSDAGAAGEPAAGEPALVGTVWQWEQTTTPREVIAAVDPARYTIEFLEDGTAAIQADCNRVTATYTTDDSGALTIVPGAATTAMCPPDTQDVAFVAGLARAAVYFFQDGKLFIDQFADAGTMQFAAAETVTAPPVKGEGGQTQPGQTGGLTGTTWQWTTLTMPSGTTTVNDPSRYSVVFNADGTANITADCNVGNWAYTTGDGGMLTITPGMMSMAYCGAGSLDQIFLGGLTNAMSYRMDGDNLVIDMLYESGSLAFMPAP